MRSLKYGVVALTPLLGAGGFAQGLNLGMNDGLVLQAQATGSYGAMNGGERPEPGREPGADRASTPVNEIVKPESGSPRVENLKSTPRAHAKARARKGEKKPQGTN